MNKQILKIFILYSLLILLNSVFTFAIDSDRDGIPDDKDLYLYDYDNDGMPDDWEIRNGLRYDVNDATPDNDNDGLTNLEEYQSGTDPNSIDSEGDTNTDYQEVKVLGTDPLKKERVIWPFIVFPILIILFVIYLFLAHQYHLDVIIKQYYYKYFPKKVQSGTTEQPFKYVKQEKPKISYINIAQINQEMDDKRKDKEKMMKAFGIKTNEKPFKNTVISEIKKPIFSQTKNSLPVKRTGLIKQFPQDMEKINKPSSSSTLNKPSKSAIKEKPTEEKADKRLEKIVDSFGIQTEKKKEIPKNEPIKKDIFDKLKKIKR